jgi:hypothetical protein
MRRIESATLRRMRLSSSLRCRARNNSVYCSENLPFPLFYFRFSDSTSVKGFVGDATNP